MILGATAQAIGRNKLRSALTMLGVFIGVAALIAMVAVGQGWSSALQLMPLHSWTSYLVSRVTKAAAPETRVAKMPSPRGG
jgi:ABC-type lipoprotein release transport system permease subunit